MAVVPSWRGGSLVVVYGWRILMPRGGLEGRMSPLANMKKASLVKGWPFQS